MTESATIALNNRLFKQLPAVYQIRDAELGGPLQAVMSVVSEQVQVVDDNLDQLYRNWFIETCDDWVVPYIAELVGFKAGGIEDTELQLSQEVARKRGRFLFPRRDVGNIIALRRRKGTLAVLEDMARDSAGWLARAVEFADLTISFESERDHHHPAAGTFSVRDADVLERVGTAFEDPRTPHLPSVRDYDPLDVSTRYGADKLGLFVWRHQIRRIERAPAVCIRKLDKMNVWVCRVHPSGIPIPLHIKPVAELSESQIAEERHRPGRLRRLALGQPLDQHLVASPHYYGPEKSVAIWKRHGHQLNFVPRSRVRVIDLTQVDNSAWTPLAEDRTFVESGGVLLDPETGTIVSTTKEIVSSYCEAAAGSIGGGPYARESLFVPVDATVYSVPPGGGPLVANNAHLPALDQHKLTGLPADFTAVRLKDSVRYLLIELNDSSVYSIDKLAVVLGTTVAGLPQTLHIRAAEGCRPVLQINGDACSGGCIFLPGANCRFILEGLMILGAGISFRNSDDTEDARRVEIAHCTFVPVGGCCRNQGSVVSVRSSLPGGTITIRSSILGAIVADQPDSKKWKIHRPTDLIINDSIIQASECHADAAAPMAEPVPSYAIDGDSAFRAELQTCTILGRTQVRAIYLAENSLFDDLVIVQRPLEGGMRFCSLLLEDSQGTQSITPPRYYCQPNLSDAEALHSRCDPRSTSDVCGDDVADPATVSADLLRAVFVSRDYGHPGYGQLSEACPIQIRQGAEDGSEQGAFHDEFVPQRKELLESRLREFTPVGMKSFVVFVN